MLTDLHKFSVLLFCFLLLLEQKKTVSAKQDFTISSAALLCLLLEMKLKAKSLVSPHQWEADEITGYLCFSTRKTARKNLSHKRQRMQLFFANLFLLLLWVSWVWGFFLFFFSPWEAELDFNRNNSSSSYISSIISANRSFLPNMFFFAPPESLQTWVFLKKALSIAKGKKD